jgi:hypothetical protein
MLDDNEGLTEAEGDLLILGLTEGEELGDTDGEADAEGDPL